MMEQKAIKDGMDFSTFWDEKVAEQFLNKDKTIKDLTGLQDYETECVKKFYDKYDLHNNGKKNVLFLGGDMHGCGYIRSFLPSFMVNKYSEKYNALFSFKTPIELVHWADIIIWQRQDASVFEGFLLAAKQIGKIQIYETDDNMHEIPMSNPVYFKFNPSKECFYNSVKWMTTCDAMIVSTPPLKEYYEENAGTNCTVIKNSVDITKVCTKPEIDSDRVRIVWSGSDTHLDDLKIIQPVIKRLKDEYGKKIKFTMVGYNGVSTLPFKEEEYEENGEKKKQIIYKRVDLDMKYDKYISWIRPVDTYIERLAGMYFDIGLCPLEDTKFNRSKSNLKWLEYSLCGVATVASNVEPYKDIENGINGVIVPNDEKSWYKAIKALIENKELRNKLSKKAKESVVEKYNINENWVEYENLFDKLMEEK